MSLGEWVDGLSRRGRGPLFAALLALVAGLPGALALPTLDRDEARFTEASAEMLESGDFTSITFQGDLVSDKPVGAHWLQAVSAEALGDGEAREIFPYRAPSLLGAMLAAAACAWGAAAFLRPSLALLAGALLGATSLLSSEASIGTTDSLLCGLVTLTMAALARLYLAKRDGPPAGHRTRALFWLGLAGAVLVKGPVGPMVALLTALALVVWERRAAWLASLGWSWGLILFTAVVGPWALAITVATDGGFWSAALGGDLAPKLIGGIEGHTAPPLFHTLLSPLGLFGASLLLPAALVGAWRGRAEPAIRFALCWLVPSLLVFEIVPTKLPHYPLPLYPAIAWLMAAALREPVGRGARIAGVVVGVAAAAAGAAACLYLAKAYGAGAASWAWAILAAALALAATGFSARPLIEGRALRAAAIACGVGLLAHAVLFAGLLPSLRPLWSSAATARMLTGAGINPAQGLAEGPVTVAGYGEPSLVFALGAGTELGDASDAADAISEGRPAVVEGRLEAAFDQALADQQLAARLVGAVAGFDYSNGQPVTLRIYEPVPDDAAP
ncbi:MAG: ArnT family glycosyltransferase [Caulobacterales bacterium]